MYELIEDLNFNIIIAGYLRSGDELSSTLIVKYLNRNASELLGYKTDELKGKSLDIIAVPEYQAGFWESALNKISDNKLSNTFECELIKRNDSRIPVLISLSPWADSTDGTDNIVLFIQDISNKKEHEKTLSMMFKAVEQSASAVLITNAKGYIEYVNPKFIEMTGYSEQELLGKSPKMLKSGGTSPEQYQTMWKLLLETGEWRGEIKDRKKNGEYYWAYETISAIKNSQGKITHFLSVEEDISKRKQAESALLESEERFRQMAEMTGEWLWEQDPKGFYIYSSNAVNEILGFNPEEIIGKHYTAFLTPQDRKLQQPYSSLASPFYALTNRYLNKNGHEIFTESTGLPIKDATGKVIKWRGVDRDITARKHFEDALIESEKRKRLIVESALNAIIIMDSYGIITDWNRQAENMFGWVTADAIGNRLEDLIIPKRFRESHRKGLEHFLRSGQSTILNKPIEQTAVRRDGSEFPVELSISPLKLGNAYIFSGFIHDITARKEAEKKIRQGEVNLAIARNEMKIAHDIQSSLLPSTPIQSEQFEIKGYCLPADQVGGDYYDYFLRDDDSLDMVIADVSGHSIGPALFMAETRSAIRTQAKWPGTPAETLSVLNAFLYNDLNNADYFITLFYLRYHAGTGQLSYANAGHPLPLLLSGNQPQCTQLDADGLILGIRDNVTFEEKVTPLQKGDMILMYTDGIVETENTEGEFFGAERIIDIFSQCSNFTPQEVIDKIMSELTQFCQTDRFNDDVTMMVFKIN